MRHLGIASLTILSAVLLVMFGKQSEPPLRPPIQPDPAAVLLLEERAKRCTAESERAMGLVIEAFTSIGATVRPLLWARANPSLRQHMAAWISLCKREGGQATIVAADDLQVLGWYTRTRGYTPAPMD
jgi:hypothetical protein